MTTVTNDIWYVFDWVKKVVISTETLEQLDNADKLIELFYFKYKDEALYNELNYIFFEQLYKHEK